jgi:hypothetical protein
LMLDMALGQQTRHRDSHFSGKTTKEWSKKEYETKSSNSNHAGLTYEMATSRISNCSCLACGEIRINSSNRFFSTLARLDSQALTGTVPLIRLSGRMTPTAGVAFARWRRWRNWPV